MTFELRMDRLSRGSDYGVVAAWLKAQGDEITEGEPLLEVEVEKATVSIPAPVTGVLTEVFAEVDDEVEVDGLLAIIEEKAAGACWT